MSAFIYLDFYKTHPWLHPSFSKVVGLGCVHLHFQSSFCLGYPWMTSVCYWDKFENFKKVGFQSTLFSISNSSLCFYWYIFLLLSVFLASQKKKKVFNRLCKVSIQWNNITGIIGIFFAIFSFSFFLIHFCFFLFYNISVIL